MWCVFHIVSTRSGYRLDGTINDKKMQLGNGGSEKTRLHRVDVRLYTG